MNALLSAVNSKRLGHDINLYRLPHFHHPFERSMKGGLELATPRGELIKAQGPKDLVALWHRLVKEAGHVEA
jgi:hypothetical protein